MSALCYTKSPGDKNDGRLTTVLYVRWITHFNFLDTGVAKVLIISTSFNFGYFTHIEYGDVLDDYLL